MSSTLYLSKIKSTLVPRSFVLVLIAVLSVIVSSNFRLIQANSIQANSSSTTNTIAWNYLLYSNSGARHELIEDAKLASLLKNSNHSHVSDTINLQLANSVWSKMRKNALEFAAQRAEQSRPSINLLLDQAKVSAGCRQSLNDIIDHLAKLNEWATQMYNAFGEFPATGFFEGSHTSMGSYYQCVDVEPNNHIGEAQYCTFSFQPIIPKRPRYHNILAAIENLANFTGKDDMFNKVASKAHYFYYTKLRLATCMPSKCEKSDLESLGEQVAINTYLQYSGVKCLKKSSGFHPDGAQVFALTILISLASVTMIGTLVHLLDLRSYFDWTSNSKSNVKSTTNFEATDLNNGNKATKLLNKSTNSNNNNNNHVVLQTLLSEKGSPILGTQMMSVASNTEMINMSRKIRDHEAEIEDNDHEHDDDDRILNVNCRNSQILRIIDVLIHFSIIQNGRKLFDTSTSAGRGNSSADNSPPSTRDPPTSRSNSTLIQASDSSSVASTSSSSCQQSEDTNSTNNTPKSGDISCVHGLRFWTIGWIIFGHTMQYTEWAGFARAYQVEHNIVSFFLQPLLNATFSVDTFFLISGLLTTYVTWSMTQGEYKRFNKFAFLISRYLRLTPQVLLVILLFIVFPLAGDGPYWRGLIQKESDNCKQNWWVSALYLQAFVNSDKICNLVTWWLSIEMFYHFVSIIFIIALLHSTKKGVLTAILMSSGFLGVSCYIHYSNSYPPNMLPTLLQRYEVWDSIVLKYFWTPYPHAPAYFVGLLLGYALYTRSINQLTRQQVRLGWIAFTVCYLSILFGTYNWNNNAPYSRVTSTVYYNLSQLFWAISTGWAILACALGHGGWLNSFLSSPLFIPLGRASYMTYLSHMLIVMSYPAKMNLLIEPSYIVFLYIFIANLFLSYALGIALTLVYESPILHLQKLLVANMAQKYNNDDSTSRSLPSRSSELSVDSKKGKFVRVSLYTQPEKQLNGNTTTNNNNNNVNNNNEDH